MKTVKDSIGSEGNGVAVSDSISSSYGRLSRGEFGAVGGRRRGVECNGATVTSLCAYLMRILDDNNNSK